MDSEFNNMDAAGGKGGSSGTQGLGAVSGARQAGNGSVAAPVESGSLEFILDVPLQIAVELGRTRMFINDLLKLGQGSVIELTKFAGETLDIMANQKLIARGEVVVTNEKYGVRLTEIVTPAERIERLR